MLELKGFEKSLFEVKRKKVNEYIKNLSRDGSLATDELKIHQAVSYLEVYLNSYLRLCYSEEDVLELVNRIPALRKERVRVRRRIAAEAYVYARN